MDHGRRMPLGGGNSGKLFGFSFRLPRVESLAAHCLKISFVSCPNKSICPKCASGDKPIWKGWFGRTSENGLPDESRCFPKVVRQMRKPHERGNRCFVKLPHLLPRLFFPWRIQADFKFARGGIASSQIIPVLDNGLKPHGVPLAFDENGRINQDHRSVG